MNESTLRKTIKTLIKNEESDLVLGLSFQGLSRNIHQITTSSLTPPTGYYFINIVVTNYSARTRNGFGNTTSVPPSEAEYSVLIEISDYAIGNPTEDQLFEKMDYDFQLFTDRIVDKLRENRYMTDIDSGTKFTLDDERNVNKTNISASWEEAAQYHALLHSRITFDVLQECTDSSTLY